MVKSISLKRPHHLVSHLTRYYLFSSFLITGAVLISYLLADISHFDLFTISLLLAGTYELWVQVSGREEFFVQTSAFPLFFLFQISCWIGVTFETTQFELMYFAYIPCLFGLFYSAFFWGRPEKTQIQKGATLFIILFTVFAVFSGIFQVSFHNSVAFVAFTLFTVWATFLTYSVVSASYRQRWLQARKIRGASMRKGSLESEENRERYFVHDLINHTHGLNLFLSNRIANNQGLNVEETRSLIAEVKTFQSMVRDYYGQSHKNLVNTYDWVAFRFARRALHQLIQSFLPSHITRTEITYSGEFQENELKEPIVHFPTFFRVMSNLIKNMADEKSTWVSIDVCLEGKNLTVTTKNYLHSKTRAKSQNLEKELSEIILEQDRETQLNQENPESLGLSSVYYLCQEVGGEFHFSIQDQTWTNSVTLPVKLESTESGDEGDLAQTA